MDVAVFVMVLSSVLRESIAVKFFTSQEILVWGKAQDYCENANGQLVVLDSSAKWEEVERYILKKMLYIKHDPFWIGLRFNSSFQCIDNGTWSYSGWGRWGTGVPNDCPYDSCVELTYTFMFTTSCRSQYQALCEIEAAENTFADWQLDFMTEIEEENITPTTSLETTSVAEALDSQTSSLETTSVAVASVSVTTALGTTSVAEALDSQASAFDTTSVAEALDSQASALDTTSEAVTSVAPATSIFPMLSTNTTPVPGRSPATTAIEATSVLPALNSAIVKVNNCKSCCFTQKEPDNDVLREIEMELRAQLVVNKSILSNHMRKSISVYDSRPSSVAIGGMACVVLAIVVGVIVVPDTIRLGEFVYKRLLT